MTKNEYIKKVLNNLNVPRKMKKRLLEDLEERIDQGFEEDAFFNIIEELGQPEAFAQELAENYDYEYSMRKGRGVVSSAITTSPYEYKSKSTLFGVPLIHINTGGTYSARVAKGIIAIGDVAIGFISVGGVSAGVFSLGGVSLGVLALGGVAIGGMALGGVAIGLFALGGVSVGIIKAFGALPFS